MCIMYLYNMAVSYRCYIILYSIYYAVWLWQNIACGNGQWWQNAYRNNGVVIGTYMFLTKSTLSVCKTLKHSDLDKVFKMLNQ